VNARDRIMFPKASRIADIAEKARSSGGVVVSFDDIKAGNAVDILTPASGMQTVIATKPIKEADGMRIIAWDSEQQIVITVENFVRIL